MCTYNNKMVTPTPLVGKTCDYLEGIKDLTPNVGNEFGGNNRFDFYPSAKGIKSKENLKSSDTSTALYVPAYVDTIYDSAEVVGTQIADLVKVSQEKLKYTVVYRNVNGLSAAMPEINNQTSFHVETSYAVVKFAAPARELNHTDFVVNNIIPVSDSIIATGERSYNVPLSAFDSKIYKSKYTTNEMGSKDAVIIASRGLAISYRLEYVLCGYVTTDEGTYSFEMTLDETEPKITKNVTSFYLQEINVPEMTLGETTYLKVNFEFDAILISPIITVNEDNTITLCDTVLITPKASIETIVNKKVLLAIGTSNK